MAVFCTDGSKSSDITHPKGIALSTTTQGMKLAIVALGLGKESLIVMVNCAANLVVRVPTLLFQTDLVADGVNPVGIYGMATPTIQP